MKYTREKLIEICEKAIVKESDWKNRDSASSQQGIGLSLIFLKAGCEFEIQTKENNTDGQCITDENTIWIQFYVKDFSWFEYKGGKEKGNEGDNFDGYFYYLPTEKRLKKAKGGDWY